MAQIAFDTLEYSNILQSGGIPRDQADVIARANANALNSMLAAHELATKKDLALVKSELETKIINTKYEIIKWLIGILLAQTGIIAAAISLQKP